MKLFRALLATAGVAMMGFAVLSAVTNHNFKPTRHVLFLVLALVLHDGLLLPVFLAFGLVVRRVVPARYRSIIQGALIISAAVTFVALPFLLAYGRTADNPSALPRNYPGGYAIVLGAIWLVATAVVVRRQISAPTAVDRGDLPSAADGAVTR